jgi:hypothetical protein
VKSASALADALLAFDADIIENRLKYSAWVAALATAGFGLALLNFDKMVKSSWLSGKPLAVSFICTEVIFLLSVACSAGVLAVSSSFLASFKRERSLISQRAFIMANHPKVLGADIEVRMVMAGVPIRFVADQLFIDLATARGGAMVEMHYDARPVDKSKARTYEDEQTESEFRLLTKQFRNLDEALEAIHVQREKDERKLHWLSVFQQLLVAAGYAAVLVLSMPRI